MGALFVAYFCVVPAISGTLVNVPTNPSIEVNVYDDDVIDRAVTFVSDRDRVPADIVDAQTGVACPASLTLVPRRALEPHTTYRIVFDRTGLPPLTPELESLKGLAQTITTGPGPQPAPDWTGEPRVVAQHMIRKDGEAVERYLALDLPSSSAKSVAIITACDSERRQRPMFRTVDGITVLRLQSCDDGIYPTIATIALVGAKGVHSFARRMAIPPPGDLPDDPTVSFLPRVREAPPWSLGVAAKVLVCVTVPFALGYLVVSTRRRRGVRRDRSWR